MLVADIIKRVRNMAGDTNVLQFTDSMLLDWINDGIRECALNNNLLQKRATSNTVIGTSKYSLPTDILKLHSATFEGSKLRVETLQEWQEVHEGDSATSTGLPQTAYIWAGELTLSPTPDRVGSLVLNYTYDPAVITMAAGPPVVFTPTTPGLPVGYHSRLVDYCLAQVAQQDGDMNLYLQKMQEFETGVTKLKDQSETEDDVYPYISVSARDMGTDGDYYYG